MDERPTIGFNRMDAAPENFIVRETDEEVRLFFHPADYQPSVKRIADALNDLAYRRICIGSDHKYLNDGEVRIFFNPLSNTVTDRHRAIAKTIEAITAPTDIHDA